MMTLKLRKANAADADVLTDIYFSAFNIDAISLLVFPRNTSSRAFWYNMIVEEMQQPYSNYMCIYDSALPTEPVVSWGKWNGPAAPPGTSDLPKWPEGADVTVGDHFFGTLAQRHSEIMGERKHWYLECIATRKDYQGRGAAGQLLRWGLARADEDGTEAYLEASPDGKPIYERFGFEERDRLVVSLEGKGEAALGEKEFVEVFMLRGVQAKDK